MFKTALILTACLFTADAAGGAGLPAGALPARPLDSAGVAVVPIWPLLSQDPDGGAAERADPGLSPGEIPASTPPERMSVAQEIVAGALTGSLAAVLMLKLLYGRRRKDDSA